MTLISLDYELKPSNYNYLHPYQQANIIVNKRTVGVIGKIHQKILKMIRLYLN